MKLSNTLTRMLGLLVLITVCILMHKCSFSQPKELMSQSEETQWIEDFYPSPFATSDEIVVEFKTPCARDTTKAIKLRDVARFSPSVRGDVTLSEDGTKMTITPTKELQQDMVYTCALHMDKIFGVDSLKDFAFDFYVVDRIAEFKQVKCNVCKSDLEKAEITGFVTFNITPTPEELEMIKISPEVGEMEIDYTEDSRTISFTITDIPRKSEDYEITVSLDFGYDLNCHKQTVKVPAIFKRQPILLPSMFLLPTRYTEKSIHKYFKDPLIPLILKKILKRSKAKSAFHR